MAISEQIQLLGAGLYTDIPDTLTLKGIPTAAELDVAGAEDFDKVMLENILPKSVEEKIDFKQLLEIDYQWICRCLRLLNYGPYYTANAVFCSDCKNTSYGEHRVDLRAIPCEPLPEGFINDIVITKDEFIDFNGDIRFKLPTIQKIMNCYKDKAFQNSEGRVNRELARMCYMITSIGSKSGLTPIEIKMAIQRDLSAADYVILKTRISEMSDFGLRAGGTTTCPRCGSHDASFIALVDDRFFRPTLGDLREWRNDRNKRTD